MTAGRALLALIGVSGCLAAVALAAPQHHSSPPPAPHRGSRLPAPRITGHPLAATPSSTAAFAVRVGPPRLRLECRLDGGRWRRCRTRISYSGLAVGAHSFRVRAAEFRGRRGRPTRFAWTVQESKSFSIVPRGELGPLYPGAAPQPIALTLTNPNPEPIFVIGLRAAVGTDPPGCAGATNLALAPSSASAATPLEIPANGSIDVPTAGVSAPTIALLELPVNQDACRGAGFPLVFSGEAHG